jgi:hypothetical protein
MADFLTDEDRQDEDTQAKLDTQMRTLDTKIAQIAAEPPVSEANPTASTISDLANGITVKQPQSKSTRINELKRLKREIQAAKDFLSIKQKSCRVEAGMRLAKAMTKHSEDGEKLIIDRAVALYDAQLQYFKAKRHLINEGTGTYGLFTSNIDDILDIPVNNYTMLAALFRDAVKDGLLRKLPGDLK